MKFTVEIQDDLKALVEKAALKNGVNVGTIFRASLRMVVKTFSSKDYDDIIRAPEKVYIDRPEVITIPVCSNNLGRTIREVADEMYVSAMERHDGDKVKAAEELGVSVKTVYNNCESAKTRIAKRKKEKDGERYR